MNSCKNCQSLLNEVKGLALRFKAVEDSIRLLKASVDCFKGDSSTTAMSPAGRVLRSKKISKPIADSNVAKSRASTSTTAANETPLTPTNAQSTVVLNNITTERPSDSASPIVEPIVTLATPSSISTQPNLANMVRYTHTSTISGNDTAPNSWNWYAVI